MMNKKSQAALEFLMTYGWAILVVLVAVGALAYFGVLSPDKFLPAKCTLQAGIGCIDHKATGTALNVVLRNSLGYDLTITDLKAAQCTAQTGLSAAFPNGQTYTANMVCVNTVSTKYNGQFNVTYTTPSDAGGLSHVNIGQITTRVE
ncbi:hypothetical protein HYX08_01300 [Candidatus Woesearchaeota archaeon]|nr:hypothetical protein [Candidatus Woesearchaeota archaeon]